MDRLADLSCTVWPQGLLYKKLKTDSARRICLFNVPIIASDSAESDWNLIQDLQ